MEELHKLLIRSILEIGFRPVLQSDGTPEVMKKLKPVKREVLNAGASIRDPGYGI